MSKCHLRIWLLVLAFSILLSVSPAVSAQIAAKESMIVESARPPIDSMNPPPVARKPALESSDQPPSLQKETIDRFKKLPEQNRQRIIDRARDLKNKQWLVEHVKDSIERKSPGPPKEPDAQFNDAPARAIAQDEIPRQGRLPKTKLTETIIGNPAAIRKKVYPSQEKLLREPKPELIKDRVLDKLNVPKEDRRRAVELKKEAMRLEREGRKEEAKSRYKDVQDLLPKVRVRSEKSEVSRSKEFIDKRPELARSVKGRINPDVRVQKRVLIMEYKNASLDRTEFTYSVEPPQGGLSSFELVVEIPKDIARSVSDIDFDIQPDEIIKDDPVVKWMLKSIPQDSVAEYSFTVNGDVQNFDTLAVAAGDSPSVVQRIINWLLNLF